MMAPRRHPVVPRIGLAAGLPLARDPPPADLDRFCRIRQIEDHHDVADIAVGGRRDIGVAAVEIVAVNAATAVLPLGYELGSVRLADVIDAQAPAELRRPAVAEPLVVDNHDAV